MYGKGISRISEILDLAVEFDIIQKRGSWFRYNGEPIGQGADSAMQFLEEDLELCNSIEKQVRNKLNGIVEETNNLETDTVASKEKINAV
jgi:recombination protein RecA